MHKKCHDYEQVTTNKYYNVHHNQSRNIHQQNRTPIFH